MENPAQAKNELSAHDSPEEETRATWSSPEVRELPRLTDLTLQTGSAIVGGGNTGDGSTVFR